MATRNGTATQQGKQGGERQKPAHQVRIGRIQGTVWANDGKDGKWFSVSITRSYKDGQNVWKQANTFGREDLLTVAEIARLCWLFVAQQNGSKLDGPVSDEGDSGNSDIPF
jgi:hypothetical protein